MNKTIMLFIIFIVMSIGTSYFALAAPVGPITLTTGASSQATISTTAKNISAQAGNVTELNITSKAITSAWQGYYGAISASLVLADSSNNNFYNWTVTSPTGEVYASPNSSITWALIHCFNYTADGNPEINLSMMNTQYGIATTDADSINNTFNRSTHAAFSVGTVSISANTCPSTYVFNATGWQTNRFANVLLTDNSSLVFTTLLESQKNGFNNNNYDFQMLVAEDGHGSASSTLTTYYFWVEIS